MIIEDKVLHPKSPLHFLPQELKSDQLMIYDSLRFTLEMIDFNREELIRSLENLSKGEENKIHYKIFNYAWGLIDHCQRFHSIYKRLNPPEDSVINKIGYVYKFRNAIQHVNKNLERVILKNRRPIYGTIKWVVSDPDNGKVRTAILVSGIFNVNGVTFRQHAQEGYEHFINNVILETDTLKKSEENEINLSILCDDIREITHKIDQYLLDQINAQNLTPTDWKSMKDIMLNLKNP